MPEQRSLTAIAARGREEVGLWRKLEIIGAKLGAYLYNDRKRSTAVVVDSVCLHIVTLRGIITMRTKGCLNNKLEKNGFILSTWNHEGNGG
mgnify:CR=1 FL=1